MADLLGLSPDELRSIPLLRGCDDDELTKLSAVFAPVAAAAGDVLFDANQPADSMYLLAAGAVTLYQDASETHQLRGPVLIGELGAFSGLTRNSRAVVGSGAVLFGAKSEALHEFFDAHCPIGLKYERNLLDISADKIKRDQTRLDDMRANLIRTQKAMKKMRDFLLESPDTVVSGPLHETLEGLIERNRRVNYRVRPPEALAAFVKMDDRSQAPVTQISRTHVSFEPSKAPAAGKRFSGVLQLSGPEIPISGKVLRVIDGRADIELDLLLDEYSVALESYLTRVQMLDFLV